MLTTTQGSSSVMLVKEWRWSVLVVVVVLWWADADHHSRQLLCYACEGMALVSVGSGSGAVGGLMLTTTRGSSSVMLVKEWRWSVSAVVVVLWWADADHHSRQLLCYACEGMALVQCQQW